jgi:hypothetical protein
MYSNIALSNLQRNQLFTMQRNPIYVFPEKELRGLSPNFQIHVSVSDLYILRVGPHIFLQQNMQVDHGKIQIAHRLMNWRICEYVFARVVCCLLAGIIVFVRHVTGNDEDYLRKIPRVVVQKSALL